MERESARADACRYQPAVFDSCHLPVFPSSFFLLPSSFFLLPFAFCLYPLSSILISKHPLHCTAQAIQLQCFASEGPATTIESWVDFRILDPCMAYYV